MELEKTKLIELKEKFDSIINTEEKENIEFWYARDLQTQLGYKRWENFIEVIKKAILSCENAEIPKENHFREVTKMISLAKGAKREVQDYMYGEESITDEHIDNNLSVRNMLNKRGIKPENLKPAEDLKKLERRVKSDNKKMANNNKLPKRNK